MVHSERPTCVAAICDGGLFPSFFYDDSFLIKRYESVSTWRLLKSLGRRHDRAGFRQRFSFIDSVFNHTQVVCTGCNEYPCGCHFKIALSELANTGKRQIIGGRNE